MKKIFPPALLLLFIPFISLAPAATALSQVPETVSGEFTTLWGDSFSDELGQRTRYFLHRPGDETLELDISDETAAAAGGLLQFNNTPVDVDILPAQQFRAAGEPLTIVEGITFSNTLMIQRDAEPFATGSQPWVSILCKFQDIASEPKNLAYFQEMYSSSSPGMDHYWREASYNRVNVSGSAAYGWYTLPQNRSYYVYDQNGDGYEDLNFTRITEDCVGQADPYVYFPAFVGINMMFNDDLDGFAWGGSQPITADGVTRNYRATWEPPWGYSSITVIAHEMGHGFGMPHSSGNYGATYDNAWDVMSDAWANCTAARHPTYGCLGQHTIGFHRDLVGWLQPQEKFTYDGTTTVITLERLTLPQSSNYRYAKIPIRGSSTHYYTVETRTRVGYDAKLVADGVIIHEVETSRIRPAYVIDIDNNGDTADSGAVWQVGETFFDSANDICVKVLSQSSSSYRVQVGCGPPPPGLPVRAISPLYNLLLD